MFNSADYSILKLFEQCVRDNFKFISLIHKLSTLSIVQCDRISCEPGKTRTYSGLHNSSGIHLEIYLMRSITQHMSRTSASLVKLD